MSKPNIHPIDMLDQKTPGQVYLCQVNDKISCGACCGLYNIADPSEENLSVILKERTALFEKTPRTEEAIDDFADRMIHVADNKPLKDFYHCPFIGYPNSKNQTVGCLLHPMADGNNGLDYRGLSYYGALACKSFFCQTVQQLSPEYKKILRAAAPNWYLYGLVITETDMLRLFFEAVELKLKAPLNADLIISNTAALTSLKAFFFLKSTWPFREKGSQNIANYAFGKHEDLWESIDYATLGHLPSYWTPVFHALYSVFESAEDIQKAETYLDSIVDQFVSAIKKTKIITEQHGKAQR